MNFSVHEKSNSVEGFCLITSCEKKISSKGSAYLDMVLSDNSGDISAKLWDYHEDINGTFEVNTIVKIRGTISQYNGADQLRIDRIRKTVPTDNINIEDYVKSAEYSGEAMLSEIYNIVNSFKDDELKLLVNTVLSENEEKLLTWPAAFKLHHAMRSGLLYHTLSILRMAQSAASIYEFIDKDLLFAGAILHDIAKIYEFDVTDSGIANGYTTEGMLIGHIAKGAMEIDKIAKKLNISNETAMLIEHMILSHHGEPDFGAAVRPMFAEAELLSELDLMDARLYEIAQATSEIEKGAFTARQWALDNRRLYNHGRSEKKVNAKLI